MEFDLPTVDISWGPKCWTMRVCVFRKCAGKSYCTGTFKAWFKPTFNLEIDSRSGSTQGQLQAGLDAGWAVSGLINAGTSFSAHLTLNFGDKIYISICDAASWIFDACAPLHTATDT